MSFDTILIANRGEIAVRVIQSARALGCRTVAVYSDADVDARHAREADQAVHIGEAAAARSYLAIDKIISAAKASGADAIHPGYGFLSENAAFARACAEAGLTFIGPPAQAIELMGNKRAAKAAMIEAGVPCVPGYLGDAQDVEALLAAASDVGFPLMVKAAAGGGGRGMRLVTEAASLKEAVQSAAREAESAFGSGELILEKAIVRPRHVEVQVFADTHGHVIHLAERDCSVQRRHQKVVEESPSPAVDEKLRARMGKAAVDAARACGYVGAGTVELLLDESGEFYFLEMNTRLQVEHPVTEMVTGVDLVAWQIRVAAGGELPLTQEQVSLRGHAIEARVYAEDPARGYMPQTGRILAFDEPAASMPSGAVRIDHGVCAGGQVSSHYDAMLAKVIAHGDTRRDALRRLRRALSQLVLHGVTWNKDLLLAVCDAPAFASGEATTGLLSEMADHPALTLAEPSLASAARAALAVFLRGAEGITESDDFIGWRSGGPIWVAVFLETPGGTVRLRVMREAAGRFVIARDDDPEQRCELTVVRADARELVLSEDGVTQPLRYAIDGTDVWLDDGASCQHFDNVTHRPATSADAAGSGRLTAPLDGAVTKLAVGKGDTVKDGQLVIVVEAMKMEHQITADIDGKVVAVHAAVGDQVKARAVLVEIEEEAS